jgi:site-specific recombinase XerD
MPFHRILVMTLYATGARRAEVARLKISDVDSERMVFHIQGGKGRKDRDGMLSNRRHSESSCNHQGALTTCQRAAERAGLEHKHIHPHTLRHYSVCRTIT